MAYKLYTDKNEVFECEVSVKNASLKGSVARLVVESQDGLGIVFNGKIENGKCSIPIRKLKGILEENSKGNIHLEIIVEDTFFKPWKSDFVVEEHTSVKVAVNESIISTKPVVKVKNPIQPPKLHNASVELAHICERFSITKSTLSRHKKDFKTILNEYFKYNPEYKNQQKEIFGQLKVIMK